MNNQVFTPAFIQRLPEDSWLLHIATDSRFAQERVQIEESIELTGNEKVSVIKKLQHPNMRQFWDTSHELMVGMMLRSRGITAHYSPRIPLADGHWKTPDWVVLDVASKPTLIVEVVSLHENEEDGAFRALIEDFQKKLKEAVPLGFWLNLNDYCPPEDDTEIARHLEMAKAVARRLEHSDLLDDQECLWALGDLPGGTGFSGTLLLRRWEIGKPSYIFPYVFTGSADNWDLQRLRTSVMQKVEKYESLCMKFDCPLVVAVCPTPLTHIVDPSLAEGLITKNGFFDKVGSTLSGIWICYYFRDLDHIQDLELCSHFIANPKALRPVHSILNDA